MQLLRSGRKKLITLGMALLLVVLLAGSALAAGQVFQDVVSGHWAEKAIAEMKAKGVIAGIGNGKFGPNQNVTRQEAIVFLVRVLGLKPAADQKLPADFIGSGQVASWAVPSVAAALDNKIIDGADALDFRPQQAAKRYEMAVFVTKALGLTDRARSLAGSSLRYTDTAQIPDWARGYVAVVDQEGIMSGRDDNFAPNDPVTRAEMAVLLERIDNKLGKLNGGQVLGEVSKLNFDSVSGIWSIWLKLFDGTTAKIPVASELYCFRDGRQIDWLSLEYSETVAVVKNAAGQAEYIEVAGADQLQQKVQQTVTGRLLTADPLFNTFSISSDNKELTYKVTLQTTITVDGFPAEISDLKTAQEIEATVLGDTAQKIVATSQIRTANGEIVSLPVEDGDALVVDVDGSGEESFYLADDAAIKLGGSEVTVEDLMAGQRAMLILQGQVISMMNVDNLSWSLDGTLKKVSYVPQPAIVVEDEEGNQKSLAVDDSAAIRRDGKKVTLRDLVSGDQLELELENKIVERIYADSVKRSTEGTVQSISRSLSGDSITFLDSDGEQQTYQVVSDVSIHRGGEQAGFSQVMIGDYVEVDLEGDVVVSMNVQPKLSQDYLVGQVDSIIDAAKVLVLNDALVQGQKHQVFVTSDTYIYWGSRTRDFSYLQKGDQVIVTGKWEADAVFMADVIVIVYHK